MKGQTLMLLLFYCVAAALTVCFYRNCAALSEMRRQRRQLEHEIRLLEARSASLRQQIEALTNDPYYIERAAREELGWKAPDERRGESATASERADERGEVGDGGRNRPGATPRKPPASIRRSRTR